MNKRLKQILNRYPMLEEDRNYIANLANGSDGGNNCPIVINVDDLNRDGTPVPLSRDIAKQIFNGALVILKDNKIWYLVNNISTHGDDFPCNLYLTVLTNDNVFSGIYVYNDEYQQLELGGGPV